MNKFTVPVLNIRNFAINNITNNTNNNINNLNDYNNFNNNYNNMINNNNSNNNMNNGNPIFLIKNFNIFNFNNPFNNIPNYNFNIFFLNEIIKQEQKFNKLKEKGINSLKKTDNVNNYLLKKLKIKNI